MIKKYKNKNSEYNIVDGGDYLSGLKKINIFVGANNSGKSRFLREIFKSDINDFVFFDDSKINKIKENISKMAGNNDYKEDIINLANNHTGDYVGRFNKFLEKIGNGVKGGVGMAVNMKNEMLIRGIYEKLEGNVPNIKYFYIPILRGLRCLDLESTLVNKKDFYLLKTEKDYEFNRVDLGNKNKYTFSGFPIYDGIKKMKNGLQEERDSIKEFEGFLSENFFQNKGIEITTDLNENNLRININSGKDNFIFNVGDGIQSIIINTFQAFKHEDDDLVLCIEEPEMMMHPSIQRALIETFINRFDKLQVFLTTHSNHFLDLTYDYPNDVSIFSFEEIGDRKFNIKNVSDNSKILDLLGIRNSSVFLSNCVIWTEGVTDRMFLRKLMKINGSEYKEDYHYAFAEYGGGNLKNFDFIDEMDDSSGVKVSALTKTNYIIIDNDNIVDEKHEKKIRREKIKEILGENNFFDKHIEIENLIPYKVWLRVIEKMLKDKSGKKIKLKSQVNDNEKKFDERLGDEKIGTLLKEYLIEAKSGNGPKYFEDEGVKCLDGDKKEIMGYVVWAIDDLKLKIDDFPENTKELIKSIINFIGKSNETNKKSDELLGGL